jgi:OmpA-OmpF porin, OOP family
MKHTLICFLLVSLRLNMAAQTLTPSAQFALLKGSVTNMKGKPLANEVIMFENAKTRAVIQATSDAHGKFEMLAPVNTLYALKYKNFTLDMNYSQMEIPGDPDAIYEVEVQIEPPKEFILDNVYFDSGKATLKPASSKALNDLVAVLKLKNTMQIQIQGHTDNVGNDEVNLKLSQDRADAVKKYLVTKGINESRVQAKGFGPTRPIADNSSEQGKSKNRRTSLKVLKE